MVGLATPDGGTYSDMTGKNRERYKEKGKKKKKGEWGGEMHTYIKCTRSEGSQDLF